MEFGLFTEFHSPPGVTEAAAFDESLAQMKAAEDFGFDAVWLAEIHFQKDRSVLSAPLIVASTLAACTQRVKIGIAVQVLPLSTRFGWPRMSRPSTIFPKGAWGSASGEAACPAISKALKKSDGAT